MQADWQAAFGPNINLGYNTPDGQVIGISAGRITLQEELNNALYNGMFPDTAQGQSLSNVCSITNFIPEPPLSSVATATITGTPGTVIPDSFQASVSGAPASVFQIQGGQAYTIGAGGTVSVTMIATQTGPIAAPGSSLTVIVTPVAGVTSITNSGAASIGNNLETEQQIRLRRILTLAQSGPNLTQIISSVLKLAGITNAGGVENDGDTVDSNSNAAHSVAILAQGTATNLAIATAIYDTKSAGIQTDGNTAVVVTDSQGIQHTINFSTPSQVNTYFDFTYVASTNPSDGTFPVNGATAIINAALAYLNLQVVGQDVILVQMSQYILSQVPGITSLIIKAGLAPTPTLTNNLSMLYNQLAVSQASYMAAHT